MAAFERIAELKIREAIAEGRFDRLPNSGQPIDLEWYFALPEHVRLGYALLKSNDCTPIEVDLLREIGALEQRLAAEPDHDKQTALKRRIRDARLCLHVLVERLRKRA
jgi:DnaJ-like protein